MASPGAQNICISFCYAYTGLTIGPFRKGIHVYDVFGDYISYPIGFIKLILCVGDVASSAVYVALLAGSFSLICINWGEMSCVPPHIYDIVHNVIETQYSFYDID